MNPTAASDASTGPNSGKSQSDGPREAERAGFEQARIENLFHFASLTPDQRVKWLVDTLEIMAEVRRSRAGGSGFLATGDSESTHAR